MRKICFILLFFISLSAYSQEQFSFLGVPMTGTLDEYVNKLCKEKGLINEGKSAYMGEPYYTLRGAFWKFYNCDISVYGDRFSNVSKAIVTIRDLKPYRTTLKLTDLVDNYDLKYGTHRVEYENKTPIYIWEAKGGIIRFRINYIPDILDSLRIDYIVCDTDALKRQRAEERKRELEGL